MESRRHFISAAGGAAALAPGLLLGQDNNAAAWTGRYSNAVGRVAVQSVLDFGHRVQTHQPVAQSLRNLQLTMTVLYGHLDEIGGTDDIEKHLRSAGGSLDRGHLEQLRHQAATVGLHIDETLFSRMVSSQSEQYAAGRPMFDRSGCRGMNAEVLAGVATMAARAAQSERAGLAGGGTLLRVQSDFCWYSNWAVWYIGAVSLWAGPAGLPLGLIALAYGGFLMVQC